VHPNPRRAWRLLATLCLAPLLIAGCATVVTRQPLSPEAEAARALLERRWKSFDDLRSLANIELRRGGRTDRLSGALLLRAPGSLRFEALSPFGPPILLVGADAESVTIWEVLRNRAYMLPPSAEANRRWLGVALGTPDIVALLSGHVLPLREPASGHLLASGDLGPSLVLEGSDGRQQIWFDQDSGQPKQVEWTGGKTPVRITFDQGAPADPLRGLTMATLDGKLEVRVRYQSPARNTRFDPDLLRVNVPQGVEIQDFR
jgi:outer membrane lipoprotein-sorting protein